MVAVGSGGEDGDFDPGQLFQATDVGEGFVGEVFDVFGSGDGCFPPGKFFVDGFAHLQDGRIGGHGLDTAAIAFVGDADAQLFQTVEDVKLGKGHAGEAVGAGGMSDDDGIEPAATTGASCGGTEFTADLAQVFTYGIVEFCGHGTAADPGGIGFGDAQDVIEHGGTDSRSGGGVAGDGGRRCDKGISPVFDIEHGPLGTFEEDRLTFGDDIVQQLSDILDVGGEDVGHAHIVVADGLEGEGGGVVEIFQHEIVVGQVVAEFAFENLPVEDVAQADATTGGPIFVGRADAATGRSDFSLALAFFPGNIKLPVIGHDQVGLGRDFKQIGVDGDPHFHEMLDLFDEGSRVEDDAVADDAELVGMHDPGGDQVQHIFLPVDDEGVSGIVPPLKAHNGVGMLCQEVDNFSLAFIPPLGSNNHDIWHCFRNSLFFQFHSPRGHYKPIWNVWEFFFQLIEYYRNLNLSHVRF